MKQVSGGKGSTQAQISQVVRREVFKNSVFSGLSVHYVSMSLCSCPPSHRGNSAQATNGLWQIKTTATRKEKMALDCIHNSLEHSHIEVFNDDIFISIYDLRCGSPCDLMLFSRLLKRDEEKKLNSG